MEMSGFWLGTEAGGGLGGNRDELWGWGWAGPGRGECVTGWGPSSLMPGTSVLTLPPEMENVGSSHIQLALALRGLLAEAPSRTHLHLTLSAVSQIWD